jgi:hypothetical protein
MGEIDRKKKGLVEGKSDWGKRKEKVCVKAEKR